MFNSCWKFKEKQNELRQILNKFDLVNYDEDEEKDELYNKYFDNLELFLLSEYEASPELTNRLVNEKISSFPFAGYKNPINHLLYFSELRHLMKRSEEISTHRDQIIKESGILVLVIE